MDAIEGTGAAPALIAIDRARCIGCFECIDVCPQVVDLAFPVFARGLDGFPEVLNEDGCIRCLSCEYSCRAQAIKVGAGGRSGRAWRAEARAGLKCRAMF